MGIKGYEDVYLCEDCDNRFFIASPAKDVDSIDWAKIPYVDRWSRNTNYEAKPEFWSKELKRVDREIKTWTERRKILVRMGVDHYNCCVCKQIFADCNDYGSCEGCNKTWCGDCDVKTFSYGDEIKCDLCFSTDPVKITEKELLKYALSKLNKTQEELIQDMKNLPIYRDPQNVYECKSDSKHLCNLKCTKIADDWDIDDPDAEPEIARGLCCVARDPVDKEDWCNICLKSSRTQITYD